MVAGTGLWSLALVLSTAPSASVDRIADVDPVDQEIVVTGDQDHRPTT